MLSDRKKEVLFHIIELYVDTVQPVSSKRLTQKVHKSVSAATIRNEMCDLEDMGYITHPHTSAGRVPTDKGYRYYVDHLLHRASIPQEDMFRIKSGLKERIEDLEYFMEKISRIVAAISHETCIAVLFRPYSFLFKQVYLFPLDNGRLRIIWLTTSGLVSNEVIDLGEDISAEYVQKITNFLNTELKGMPLDEIENLILGKLSAERSSLYDIYSCAQQIARKSITQNRNEQKMFLDGRNYFLEKPEFYDADKTRQVFQMLESKDELFSLLYDNSTSERIKVSIGKENGCDNFWDCSLISARCQLRNCDVGSIHVLGPRRIHYGRVVSLLEYISDVMTKTFNRFDVG